LPRGEEWAGKHREPYTAETMIERWGRIADCWTEDQDDLRCCHFCAELERERRRMHGLPPVPECHEVLPMNLTLAEELFWHVNEEMNHAWSAIREHYAEDYRGMAGASIDTGLDAGTRSARDNGTTLHSRVSMSEEPSVRTIEYLGTILWIFL
jgi:hypothetical protein